METIDISYLFSYRKANGPSGDGPFLLYNIHMENNQTKTDLIKGEEFEKALSDAAKVKRENLTSVKTRNKDNYSRFYDIMVMSRKDIQNILDNRKKDRTDADNEKLKNFKKETSQSYRQICNLLAPEVLEDGELSKIQKLVQKIAPIVKLMEYIGCDEIETEFKKYGITLDYLKLSDSETIFENEQVENDIKEIFETGKKLKDESNKNNETIKEVIFETSVPTELRFDKSTNPTGIKNTDFCKLVDLKTKMLMAASVEAQEKLDDQINDLAGQCEFDSARSRLIQSKLINFQTEETDE